MRTSEVAAQAGVNAQTLRCYERRGLLAAPERSPVGCRTCPPEAVGVVQFIKRAQQLGFTLDDIEELLHLAAGGPESCHVVRLTAMARLEDLERRIAHLRSMQHALSRLVDTCDRLRAERVCPVLGEIERDAAHPGWADAR